VQPSADGGQRASAHLVGVRLSGPLPPLNREPPRAFSALVLLPSLSSQVTICGGVAASTASGIGMMRDLPAATVTFLFTDTEGSTALRERDRAAMRAAGERHIALSVRPNRGTVTTS
jgi:hypothetical protein